MNEIIRGLLARTGQGPSVARATTTKPADPSHAVADPLFMSTLANHEPLATTNFEPQSPKFSGIASDFGELNPLETSKAMGSFSKTAFGNIAKLAAGGASKGGRSQYLSSFVKDTAKGSQKDVSEDSDWTGAGSASQGYMKAGAGGLLGAAVTQPLANLKKTSGSMAARMQGGPASMQGAPSLRQMLARSAKSSRVLTTGLLGHGLLGGSEAMMGFGAEKNFGGMLGGDYDYLAPGLATGSAAMLSALPNAAMAAHTGANLKGQSLSVGGALKQAGPRSVLRAAPTAALLAGSGSVIAKLMQNQLD